MCSGLVTAGGWERLRGNDGSTREVEGGREMGDRLNSVRRDESFVSTVWHSGFWTAWLSVTVQLDFWIKCENIFFANKCFLCLLNEEVVTGFRDTEGVCSTAPLSAQARAR
jgi:hypothetical protein